MSEFVRQIEQGQELHGKIKEQIQDLERLDTILRELTMAQTCVYRLITAIETIAENLETGNK